MQEIRLQKTTSKDVEKAIAICVKQYSDACAGFIGVIIKPCERMQSGANWDVKGIRYGKAFRPECDTALSNVIPDMQRRFWI